MKKAIIPVILFLLVSILAVFIISEEPPPESPINIVTSSEWVVTRADGVEAQLTFWTANAKDKKTELGWIPPGNDCTGWTDQFLYDQNNNQILDDKAKAITLKCESAKCAGQNCYHISLTNAAAVNIDEYVKLGSDSVVTEYQSISRVQYEYDTMSVNATLQRCEDDRENCGVAYPDVMIVDSSKLKFGAEDTGATNNTNYKYIFETQKRIREDTTGNYFIETGNIIPGGIGQNIKEIVRINTNDICTWNQSNCEYSLYIDNQTNILEVIFLAEYNGSMWIDPQYTISSFDDSAYILENTTVEGNFTHIAIDESEDVYITFDGSGDAVNMGDPEKLNISQSFSISAWLRGTGTNSQLAIIGRLQFSQATGDWGLYENLNRFRARVANTSNYMTASAGATYTVGQWYHVVMTRNITGDLRIYIDTVIQNTWTGNTGGETGRLLGNRDPGNFRFGIQSDGAGSDWEGSMDEVRFYNLTLNQANITEIYNSGRTSNSSLISEGLIAWWPIQDGGGNNVTEDGENYAGTITGDVAWSAWGIGDNLIGYWNFDGEPENQEGITVYDWSTANNDGAANGNAVINNSICPYGNCLHLDGNGDYIDMGNLATYDFLAGDNYTVMLWARLDLNNVHSAFFGNSGSLTDSAIKGWVFYKNFDEKVYYRTSNGGGGGDPNPQRDCISTTAMTVGQWTHLAAVINDTNGTIYFNGVADTASCENMSMDVDNSRDFTIGYDSNSARLWNGTIDEIMIFNISLTPAQIKAIYENQSHRFVDTGTQEMKQFNQSLDSDWVSVRESSTSLFSSNFKKSLGEWKVADGYSDSDWSGYDNLVAYWHFDEDFSDATTPAYDLSPNNGAHINDTDGVFGNSSMYSDDSSMSAYKENTDLFRTPNATWSIWLNTRDGAAGVCYAIGYGVGTSRVLFGIYQDDFVLHDDINNEGQFTWGTSGDALPDNIWNHLLLVIDVEGNKYMYLNAELVATDSTGSNLTQITAGTSDFYVGVGAGGSGYCTALIDEVMIFNRTLNQSEVTELYVKGQATFTESAFQTTEYFRVDNESTNFKIKYLFEAGTDNWYSPVLKVSDSDQIFGTSNESINNCSYLLAPNKAYTQLINIVDNALTGDCIVILAENVTYDCNSKTIRSDDAYTGVFANEWNATIKNCDIDMASGAGGIGVEFGPNADKSTVDSCTFGDNDGQNKDIASTETTDFLNITDNTMDNTVSYTISLDDTSSSVFNTNTVSDTGGTNNGILIVAGTDNNFTGNAITTTNGDAVKLGGGSNYFSAGTYTAGVTSIDITGNTNTITDSITIDGSVGNIKIVGSNNNLSYVSITPTINGVGVEITGNFNSLDNVNTLGCGGYDVLITGDNNNITNGIYDSGSGEGVYLSGDNNYVLSTTVQGNTGGSCFYIDGDNNNLSTVTANTCGIGGVYIASGTNNNVEDSAVTLAAAGFGGIDIQSNNNNVRRTSIDNNDININLVGNSNNITDCILLTPTSNDVASTGSGNILLNTTYDITKTSIGGDILRQWYYRAYVNDSNAVPVNSANVSAYNVSNEAEFNISTDSTGYTPTTTITEYSNFGGTRYYYNNYTIKASNGTATSIWYDINVTGNLVDEVLTLDIIIPTYWNASVAPPTPLYYLVNQSVYFNITWLEDNPHTAYLSINDTNYTMQQTGNIWNYTVTNLESATYTYYFWMNDTVGNTNTTGLSTYIITPQLFPSEGGGAGLGQGSAATQEAQKKQAALCPEEANVVQRVFSKCRIPDNDICDDGENLFIDPDCQLTKEDFSTGKVFTYMWLFRFLLVVAIILLANNSDKFPLIVIGIVILLFYNQAFGVLDAPAQPAIAEAERCKGMAFFNNIGYCIWPTDEVVGIYIAGAIAALAGFYLYSTFKKKKKKPKPKTI